MCVAIKLGPTALEWWNTGVDVGVGGVAGRGNNVVAVENGGIIATEHIKVKIMIGT